MASMEEVLYVGKVTLNDFPQLVTDCGFSSHRAYALVEQLPARVITRTNEQQELLHFTHFDPVMPFATYTSGRVFDEHAELRWEKQESMMRVVYLGTIERAEVLLRYKLQKKDEQAALKPAEEKKYIFFGERIRSDDLKKIGPVAQVGDFAEVRIPRILRYPVPQNEQRYARLTVREYLDEQSRVILFRFQNVESWSSPS